MAKKQQRSRSNSSLWTLVIVAAVAVSLAFGVFLVNRPSPAGKTAASEHANMPDHVPPEPQWMKNALQPVRQAYIYAAWNPEPLQYIPCYCGCGNIHGSNAACYFKRDEEGNVLAYDEHAYG